MPYYRNQPYKPGQSTPYIISRSKIELFTQCPRCFWLDAVKGIKRPSTPPFQINKAIDELFKKEFDTYRLKKQPHPIMIENQLVDVVPYSHKDLNKWRDTFKGIRALHGPTNLEVFGGVDDIWVNKDDELIVVDYKATAKNKEINLDADWQMSYKRQLEIYQWLFKQNGFKVNSTGYFVYANGIFDGDVFNDTLKFKTKLIAHTGDTKWVDKTLEDIKDCLESNMPSVGSAIMGGECEYCNYSKSRTQLTLDHIKKTKK